MKTVIQKYFSKNQDLVFESKGSKLYQTQFIRNDWHPGEDVKENEWQFTKNKCKMPERSIFVKPA